MTPTRQNVQGFQLPSGFCADSGGRKGAPPEERKGSGGPKPPEPAAMKTQDINKSKEAKETERNFGRKSN
jgi:hypothetical protein